MTKRTASRGSVYPRCGCRDQEHRQLGQKCLHLGHPGHGSWSFTVSVAVQGGTSRVRRSGFPSRKDAQAALTQYRQRDSGAAAAGTWTTGKWLQHWLTQRRGVRPSTARSYESHIRLYLTPALGRIPLDELTCTDVQAMIDAIVDDHATRGRPVSPMTLVRIRATLRSALRRAVHRGLISSNPATMIELPPHVRPHPVVWTQGRVAAWHATGERPVIAVWTAEQLHVFLAFTANDPLHPLWRLIALTGLRRGEARGLRWADLDLDTGQLMIIQQLIEVGGRVVAAPPKTAASRRTIPVDATTLQMLRRHRPAPDDADPPSYVFTDPTANRYDPAPSPTSSAG